MRSTFSWSCVITIKLIDYFPQIGETFKLLQLFHFNPSVFIPLVELEFAFGTQLFPYEPDNSECTHFLVSPVNMFAGPILMLPVGRHGNSGGAVSHGNYRHGHRTIPHLPGIARPGHGQIHRGTGLAA